MTGGSVVIAGAFSERGPLDIVIENGSIVASGPGVATNSQFVTIDAHGLLAIPGVIDPHVHMRDLRQSDKETWETGSAAALAGGVTMVFDMPNTVPPTTDRSALDAKRAASVDAPIRTAFFVGAAPGKLDSVQEILESEPEDVVGLKLYMAGSSSDEVVHDTREILDFFALAASYNLVVAVHAEDQAMVTAATRSLPDATHLDHGRCRPREAAVKATERAITAAQETGARLYLCHVSTAEELDLVRRAKETLDLFCEVTPHHAFLDESILKSVGNLGKVNPPLRTPRDRECVVRAMVDGTADTVGSDHAPHTVAEKSRSYGLSPSGFPGLETSLGVLTSLVNTGELGISRLVDLTSRNAARIFSLSGRGSLDAGSIGDVTLVDLGRRWLVRSIDFKTKARYSPFEGRTLTGRVTHTVVGGKIHRRGDG
ncbi:MAG: dihydroorotase family protein [Spirochaetaceae bacterium]|nr:dihydroorotase family protein [Spirochaetaceae bacterium]